MQSTDRPDLFLHSAGFLVALQKYNTVTVAPREGTARLSRLGYPTATKELYWLIGQTTAARDLPIQVHCLPIYLVFYIYRLSCVLN